ncbi:MAG: hypothetical protein MJY63_01180 [Paludibacteraceae bacterium]|nr:hypothetical protein [Paludibacteraceae bacterium]
MKKLFLFVAVVISAISAIASDQFYVIMKDGSAKSFPSDKVDSITFDAPQIANTKGFSVLMAEIDKLKKEIEVLKSNGGGSNITSPDLGSLNGHDYVDLDLPSGLKWATMNVGATKPEEYGDYFAWGEVKTKDSYDWDNCTTKEKTESQLLSASIIGKNCRLTAKYDAASQNWGGKWRMPTTAEFQELRIYCTWTWSEYEGVYGYKVSSSRNGKSIFLPAAGSFDRTSNYYEGERGYYWCSNMYTLLLSSSYYFSFDSESFNSSYSSRSSGRPVRPVSE